MTNKQFYEDKSSEIDSILLSKKSFWTLDAISHIGYDDVCQIIRIHIYNKFEQWKQTEPFAPWVSRLINNQIINLKTKFYGKHAPPCSTCEFNLGNGQCSLTISKIADSECEKFRKWKIKKESAYRIMLAESTDKAYDEDPDGEGRIRIESQISPDYVRASEKLHFLVMEKLDSNKRDLYKWFFIENRTDSFVAEKMGFKTTEKNKSPGYKQISNLKKSLIERAKKIMSETDIFSE